MVKRVLFFAAILLCIHLNLSSQCNNFTNSIIVPAAGTVNNCNLISPSPTATICADFNISFTNGNASFFYGYIINGVTTTIGPINSNQPALFPNIVCVEISCGATITFFINAYSNPNGGGSLCSGSNATVATSPFSPLPVELVSFELENTKNQSKLVWTTASEINNEYFLIEKSDDGYHWQAIDKVPGSGNSSQLITYEYSIPNLHLDRDAYWRLKQVDYDGKFDYSHTVFSKGKEFTTDELKLYPNPAQNSLKIGLAALETENYNVNIYDNTGKKVFVGNKASENMDISMLQAGMYIIEIHNGSKSFVKLFNKI